MASRTIHSLDLLRVAAACGVMGAHFISHVHARLGVDLGVIERLNFVDLFFVLSGFLLASIYHDRIGSSETFARFLQARMARLYPLHAIIACAFAFLGIALHILGIQPRVPSTFDPAQLPSHLALLHAWNGSGQQALNFPSWSLSAEFFLLLVFPILLMVMKRAGYRGMIALALVSALGFHALNVYRGAEHWTGATSQLGNLRALPFFIAGMAVADFVRERGTLTLSWRIPAGLALTALTAMLLDWPHEISLLLFPLLIGSMVLAERRHCPAIASHPAVGRLSKLSYGVFLLHTISGIALIQVVKLLDLQSPLLIVLLMALMMPLTFLASAVTNRLIEKPAEALLRPGHGRLAALSPWLAGPGLRYASYALPAMAAAIALFMAQRTIA